MNGLIKSFTQFTLGNIMVLVLGLMITLVSSRVISPYENGKYSMFITINSLIILLSTLGMDQAYVRYNYLEDEEKRGVFLKHCLALPVLINIILGICILFLYKPISKFIIGKQSFLLVVAIVLNSTFTIVFNFAVLYIRMKQKAVLYSIVNSLSKVAYLITMLISYVYLKDNYFTLIIAVILSNLIIAIVAILLERKDWFYKIDNIKFNTSMAEMIKFGSPFIFSMSIIWVFQSIDKISLKTFSDYTQVGLYAGAINIVSLLNVIQSGFTAFWVPVAYEHYSKKPDDKEFFILVNEIVSFAMLFLSIILIGGKDLIIMLLGSSYREAVNIFPYLVFMPIMYTISETTVLGVNFAKKTRCHIYIAIISATSNIIGNLILVPRFGAVGAAISTGIAYIIFFVSRTYYSNKYYKINFKLKKFAICIIAIYILAIYSTINTFNISVIILTLGVMIILLLLYRDVICKIHNIIKEFIVSYNKEK